jgi:hypothetical protein
MDLSISRTESASQSGREERKIDFALPRSASGRCVFAAVCLLLLPVSAGMLWLLVVEVPLWPLGPAAPLGRICTWIVILIFVALFEYMSAGLLIFSIFGLAWSIARPDWAARALQSGSRKMVRGGKWALYFILTLLCLIFICSTAGLL